VFKLLNELLKEPDLY